jgi:hypothetical protein
MRRGIAIFAILTAALILAPAAFAVRVAGRVVYAGGPTKVSPPAANLPLLVESGERIIALAHTGPNGGFRINLAPGRYTLVPLFARVPHERCTARTVNVSRTSLRFFILGCPVK